jgi:hypothetical protein
MRVGLPATMLALRLPQAVGVVALLWALAGCAGGSGSDAVQVEATEYAYEMPDRIEGGLVTMEFTNSGDEVHEWAFGRLEPGRSEAEFRRELLAGNAQSLGSIDEVAGVFAMTPGASLTLARELEPGRYVIYCSMPAPRHAHFQFGMIRWFGVEGVSDAGPPEVDGTITAREELIEVPELGPGTHTLRFENAADDPREFKLLSLKPGQGLQELERWFEDRFRGDPPADLLGAFGKLLPGETAYVTLTFEAGRRYHLFDGVHLVAARFDIE